MTIVLLLAFRLAVTLMSGGMTAAGTGEITPQTGVVTVPADPANGSESNVPILPDAPKPGT
jgi:hypothetical protein